MHRIHLSPDANEVSSCTMIFFFLLNLAKLIHSTISLTYLASFLQAGLQTNARDCQDIANALYISSTFPSPTEGTSFSKPGVKKHTQAELYKHQPLGLLSALHDSRKMQTKQKHPPQFYFKCLNSFPHIHINPQTNTELHCIPKTKYTFQGPAGSAFPAGIRSSRDEA